MPKSRQWGLRTFGGVSINTAGRRVVKQNSQKTLDQSVTMTSAVRMVSFELKSCSKYSSSGPTDSQRACSASQRGR